MTEWARKGHPQISQTTRSVAPTPMEGSRPQSTIGNQITAKVTKNAKTIRKELSTDYADYAD